MHDNDRLELSPHVRFRAVGDEGVVVQVEQGQVIVTNGVALRTLELIREHGSKAAMLDRLAAEFDVTDEELVADVAAFLQELREHGLLRTGGGAS